jgi:hypothetical protein
MATSRREHIGPERAKELLETMGQPTYPVDPRQVELYAERMKSGAWGLRGSALVIEGLELERMVSGRRRMHAVVHAGVEVEFVVIRGESGEFAPLCQREEEP